ncbi:MAG: LLM class flavin-dependent oxidoreductase [Acidimicrobiales bacterium]
MAASFRFGGLTTAGPREATEQFARTAETVGLDTILMADHLIEIADAPTSLMFMADQTDRIRIGTYVMCADFRHPVVMARGLANIDELSGGRLEVGLRAGYLRREYEAAGIPLASGTVRLARLQETTAIVKAMLTTSPVEFTGNHFALSGQVAFPVARQRPRPPFLIGGGGPKLLSWAAAEADIVSFVPQSAVDATCGCRP